MKIVNIVRPDYNNVIKKVIYLENDLTQNDIIRVNSFKDTYAYIEKYKGEILIINENDFTWDMKECIYSRFNHDDFRMMNIVKPACAFCTVCLQNGVVLLNDDKIDIHLINKQVNEIQKSAKNPEKVIISIKQTADCPKPELLIVSKKNETEAPVSKPSPTTVELPFIERKCKKEKGLQKIFLDGVSYFIKKGNYVKAMKTDGSFKYFLGTLFDVENDCLEKGIFLKIDSGILINLNQVKNYFYKESIGVVNMLTGAEQQIIVSTQVDDAKKILKKHIPHLEIVFKKKKKKKKKPSPKKLS